MSIKPLGIKLICTGEIRIYVGGKMELLLVDGVFEPYWIPGNVVVISGRYNNRAARKAIIERAKESFGEFEVGIIPDDVDD